MVLVILRLQEIKWSPTAPEVEAEAEAEAGAEAGAGARPLEALGADRPGGSETEPARV